MNQLPNLPCMCSSIRRASRALTQMYEQALRPLGLRSSQFTILQVLSRAGEVLQGQLGEMLAMDSTTLTRTVDTHIASLRDKLEENPRHPALIVTAPGVGYKFVGSRGE